MEVIKKKKDLGLKKFLKSLDIYGINVSFTINKESTSKTLVGGILTILSFLTFLIYGYFISQNLLYHKNPVIARIGYIGGNYTDIENILSVIPISFKFEGIEIDNLFNYFTVFTYYEVLNVSNNELIIVEEIPFEKCNKNYYPDISENTYYSEISNESLCLNGTNLKNKPKLFLSEGKKGLIFIQLSYCRKEKNPNCESKEKIMDFINGTKNSFSIKLGITGLYPLNYKNPLLHSLETYSIIPTIHYLKNIDISIQEEDLETDDGYFIEKSKKIRTFSSFKAFPFFQKDNNDINLAFFTINPSNRIINNIRTYDRIQDILAKFGGMLSFSFHIFPYFVYIISKGRRDEKILNTLLSFTNSSDNKNNISSLNYSHLKSYIDDFKGNFYKNETKLINNYQNDSDININHGKIQNNKCNKDLQMSIKEENEIKIFLDKWKNSKESKIRFTNWEIVKIYLCQCKCFKSKVKSKKELLYFKYKEMINQYLDIPYFISKLEEFDKLKYIIFSKEQLSLFKYISNDKISKNFILQNNHLTNKRKFYNNDKEISSYIVKFVKKKKKVPSNEIEKRLIKYFYDFYNF